MTNVEGRFLAVIPARGGSKRIPRKNIRDFHGLPLLGHTIGQVRQSGLFDEVVVSTDDAEIADVASRFGGLVPFMRPADLSDDWTPTAPVVSHAIQEMTSTWGVFDAVCCIYPGAVLMTADDYVASSALVDEALRREAVVAAVVKFGHPIQRALRLADEGLLVPEFATAALTERSQDLAPMWHDAGQFYWASPTRWDSSTPLLSAVVPYEVPSWRVQDIDNEDDWLRAEMIFSLTKLQVQS